MRGLFVLVEGRFISSIIIILIFKIDNYLEKDVKKEVLHGLHTGLQKLLEYKII